MCVYSVHALYVYVCLLYMCVICVCALCVHMCMLHACVCAVYVHVCTLCMYLCVYVVCEHECMYAKFVCVLECCMCGHVCVRVYFVCIYTVGVCAHALPSVQSTRHTVLPRATHTSQGAQVWGVSASHAQIQAKQNQLLPLHAQDTTDFAKLQLTVYLHNLTLSFHSKVPT